MRFTLMDRGGKAERFAPFAKTAVVLCLFGIQDASAEVIWSGDYETGNFRQWPKLDGTPQYSGIPRYGRPPRMDGDPIHMDYYGIPPDESTLRVLVTNDPALERPNEVIAGPVRQGSYASRIMVKSEAGGGTEIDGKDCDPAGGHQGLLYHCGRRRSEIWVVSNMPRLYPDALPYMSERWISGSFFVPSDWDTENGSGWGPIVLQFKCANSYGSPAFSIIIRGNSWNIHHIFSDEEGFPSSSNPQGPWQRSTHYNSINPIDNHDQRDFIADFPNEAVSRAALGELNRGGWTDWIIHAKFDARADIDGGTGFFRVWKRAGDGHWIHVLEILPKVVTVRGVNYNRGIGYHSEHANGYGIGAGMYMEKSQVWDLPANRVIYNDNIKVASEKATFEMMTPEYGQAAQSEALSAPNGLRIIVN